MMASRIKKEGVNNMLYEGKVALIELLVRIIKHTYKCTNRKLCMHTVDDILDGVHNYFECIDLKGDD